MKKKIFMILILILVSILFYDFTYYADKEKKLITSDYIDASLGNSFAYPVENKNLIVKNYLPVSITKLSDNKYLYDFGKVYFGTIKLKTHSKSNNNKFSINLLERFPYQRTEMNRRSIGHFEKNNLFLENNLEYFLPLQTRHLPKKESLPSNIDGIIPFRYAVIDTELSQNDFSIEQVAITYPLGEKYTTFISSDKDLNKIFELAKHSVIATSFSELLVDGHRERLPYEADAYIAQLGIYSLSIDISLVRRTQLYLLNNPNWPVEWTIMSIFMAKEDYIKTKDLNYLSAIYKKLKERTFLDYISQHDNLIDSANLELNGVKLKSIIDWPYTERDDFCSSYNKTYKDHFINLAKQIRLILFNIYGYEKLAFETKMDILKQNLSEHEICSKNFVINAYLYQALKDMSYMSKELGNSEDSELYSNFALKIKQRLNESFYDSSTGLYFDSQKRMNKSFHTQLFALAFNIADDKEKIINFLIKNKDKASTYTSFYLLKILFDNSPEEAYKYLLSKNDRSWLSMINKYDSTITMESWNDEIKPNLDYNHVWASHPLYFIVRYIIGFKINENKNILNIEPLIDTLDSFNGEYIDSDGIIKYNFKKLLNKENFNYEFIGFKNKEVTYKFKLRSNQKFEKVILNGIENDSCVHLNNYLECSSNLSDSNFEIIYKEQ
jgi:hypothetical protein